jgi:hypothetical protein
LAHAPRASRNAISLSLLGFMFYLIPLAYGTVI